MKLPAKRKRQTVGEKHRLPKTCGAEAGQTGVSRSVQTRMLSPAKRATLDKNQGATEAEKKERAATATKWLEGDAYTRTPTGFKPLVAAVEQQILFLGVPDRVIKPKNVGEGKYNCCTMGHVGLPAAIFRDYLQIESGVRSSRRRGVADGMYEQFAAELRWLHKWMPTHGTIKHGLLLVDGESKNRCTFEADAADAVLNARLLSTENQVTFMPGATSDACEEGSGCVGEGGGADKFPGASSENEEEGIDFEEARFGVSGGGGVVGSPGAVDDGEGGDLDDDGERADGEADDDGEWDESDDDDADDDDDDVMDWGGRVWSASERRNSIACESVPGRRLLHSSLLEPPACGCAPRCFSLNRMRFFFLAVCTCALQNARHYCAISGAAPFGHTACIASPRTCILRYTSFFVPKVPTRRVPCHFRVAKAGQKAMTKDTNSCGPRLFGQLSPACEQTIVVVHFVSCISATSAHQPPPLGFDGSFDRVSI